MDEKLNSTIDKIVQLSKQNPEFDVELRKRLQIPSSVNTVSVNAQRLDQIYEFCIEKVVRKQATEFYKDFPISSIVDSLIEDYCRMELFRRKDNFGDFCLAVYQQIECISNKVCVNTALNEIAEKMWGYPAYVKSGKGITPTIDNRIEIDYTIASLVFPGTNKKTGLPHAIEKSKIALQSQFARDKIRAIVYFLGYKCLMKSSDYERFVEFTDLLCDVYECRNTNHRGSELMPWEQEILDRVLSHKSVYYFKFIAALTQFVLYVKETWNCLPSIAESIRKISSKKVELGKPKVVGKIDIIDDGRKRFK